MGENSSSTSKAGHEVLSPRRLRNGSVLPSSSDVITSANNQANEDTDSQRLSSVLPQSHPVPGDNQLLTNALLSLMEQNKVLLSRLVNDNTPPRMQSCTPNNGYYVMPDFNHSLTDFSGRESNAEARAWLHSIESVAKLHNWPDNFKLETVRSKLIGPSHNWYVGRTFSNWTSFVDQFTNTFVGHEQCTVDRVKIMSNRVQLKGE